MKTLVEFTRTVGLVEPIAVQGQRGYVDGYVANADGYISAIVVKRDGSFVATSIYDIKEIVSK